MPTRFTYDSLSNYYTVREREVELSFAEKETNYFSYSSGIESRKSYLGNTYLLHNINFIDGDVVIDCGANVGDFYLYLNTLQVSVDYIAIEPSPKEYFHLERNVKSGSKLNIGLSNENREMNFYVSSRRADSSFIEPQSYTQIIQIVAKRLDSMFPNLSIKLLKLEAEGSEFEVLLGAEKILSNISYIAADLGEQALGKSVLPKVVNFLLERDFEIIDFGFHRTVILFKNKCLLA